MLPELVLVTYCNSREWNAGLIFNGHSYVCVIVIESHRSQHYLGDEQTEGYTN